MNVKHNIIANFAGSAWAALIGLAFVPVYLGFLGVEAYGLVGVYASLAALAAVFDLGLGTTLNRQLARLSATSGTGSQAADLTRTLEWVCWASGILIGLAVAALAPLIARHWLNVSALALEQVERAAMLMGLALALQWPAALYGSGLAGLQRQVQLNAVRAALATVQAVGAALVLWLVSPTIVAFFLWQAAAGVLASLTMAACLWGSLEGGSGKPAFRGGLLRLHWRFAAGVAGIAVLVAFLTQADKLVLSRMLPLETFGYYTLAGAIAAVLSALSGAVYAAYFPKLSQAAAEGSEGETARLYHQAAQAMAVVALPPCVVVALYAEPLLALWLGDGNAAARAHLILALLVTGAALNGIYSIPYALQLAHGWSGLMLRVNAVALVLFVPLVISFVSRDGAEGAALAWIALNGAYIALAVPLMHRRLLRQDLVRWYVEDFGVPAAAGLLIGAGVRATMPADAQGVVLIVWVTVASGLTLLAVAMTLPHVRTQLLRMSGRAAGAQGRHG